MTNSNHLATTTPPMDSAVAPKLQNPQNPTERLSVEALFGERFEGGLIEKQYTLNTPRIKQFYRRDFVYVSRLFYGIDSFRRIWQLDSSALDAIETQLAKKMSAVSKLLQGFMQQAQAAMTVNGFGAQDISYAKPINYVVPIISPAAREYMELLVQADETLAKVDACHLLGLIKSADKHKTENDMRKAIRAISATVRGQRIALLKYANAVRKDSDPDARKVIAEFVGKEIADLMKQRTEDPDAQAPVSEERDLQRAAEAAANDAAQDAAATAALAEDSAPAENADIEEAAAATP